MGNCLPRGLPQRASTTSPCATKLSASVEAYSPPRAERFGNEYDQLEDLHSLGPIHQELRRLCRMTALTLQGHAHYLHLGSNPPVSVYGETIPKWLHRLPLNAPINAHNVSLFSDPALGLQNDDVDLSNALPWDWQLKISPLERAVTETMDGLPHRESFHSLDMVFQSLMTLRPKLLSALLHSCKRIKVRRLFFASADWHDHPWRKYLDPKEFDLGHGDRALHKGGKMHPATASWCRRNS